LAGAAEQLGVALDEGEPLALGERFRHLLAVELVQFGLRLEEFELAGGAGHEQVDDRLGPGGEVRLLPGEPVLSRRLVVCPQRVAAEQRTQCYGPEADGAIVEEVPPRAGQCQGVVDGGDHTSQSPESRNAAQAYIRPIITSHVANPSKTTTETQAISRRAFTFATHSRVMNSSKFISTRATAGQAVFGSALRCDSRYASTRAASAGLGSRAKHTRNANRTFPASSAGPSFSIRLPSPSASSTNTGSFAKCS